MKEAEAYEILGLEAGASPEAIKESYWKKAQKPMAKLNANADDRAATAEMCDINEARGLLLKKPVQEPEKNDAQVIRLDDWLGDLLRQELQEREQRAAIEAVTNTPKNRRPEPPQQKADVISFSAAKHRVVKNAAAKPRPLPPGVKRYEPPLITP